MFLMQLRQLHGYSHTRTCHWWMRGAQRLMPRSSAAPRLNPILNLHPAHPEIPSHSALILLKQEKKPEKAPSWCCVWVFTTSSPWVFSLFSCGPASSNGRADATWLPRKSIFSPPQNLWWTQLAQQEGGGRETLLSYRVLIQLSNCHIFFWLPLPEGDFLEGWAQAPEQGHRDTNSQRMRVQEEIAHAGSNWRVTDALNTPAFVCFFIYLFSNLQVTDTEW